MKPTGLPPLPLPLDESQRRALSTFLREAVERVRREARAQAVSGEQERGRVEGAESIAHWLISSLPPPPVAE